MLVHRPRRWPSIKSTVVQHLNFTVYTIATTTLSTFNEIMLYCRSHYKYRPKYRLNIGLTRSECLIADDVCLHMA